MLALIFIGIILNHLGLLNGMILGFYIAAIIIEVLIKILKFGFVIWIFEEI